MNLLRYSIALMMFLAGLPSWALAAQEPAPCPVQQSQNARAKFKVLYDQGKNAESEAFLAAYIDKCSEGMYRNIEPVSLQYWMVSDLMVAQEKTQHFNACIARGLGIVHQWAWGEEIEKESKGKAMSAVKFNLEKCRSGLSALQKAQFSSARCPIEGYGHAVEIPRAWGWSESQGVCIDLYPGKPLTEAEYTNLPENADTKKNAPYLVLVRSNGKGGYDKQKLPFAQGNLSEGEGCGDLRVGLGNAGEKKLVLLSGLLGFCWPGNASWAVDAVYSVEPSKASLVNEVVVGIH